MHKRLTSCCPDEDGFSFLFVMAASSLGGMTDPSVIISICTQLSNCYVTGSRVKILGKCYVTGQTLGYRSMKPKPGQCYFQGSNTSYGSMHLRILGMEIGCFLVVENITPYF